MSDGSLQKARKIVDDLLGKEEILSKLQGRALYAVGGAWRNLARLHMAQNHYPLSVLHHYELQRTSAQAMASLVSGLSSDTLRDIKVISSARAETLPYGALVLDRLLRAGKPESVVISAYGVREGLLFSKLQKRVRSRDPLIEACSDFSRLRARSPQHSSELCTWTDQLFGTRATPESPRDRILRHAACLLADIGWRAHPDYRGDRSLTIISQGAFVGITHAERVFLALTVYYRYEGIWSEGVPAQMRALVDEDATLRARIISSSLRLAYLLSGAMPDLLLQVKLAFDGKRKLRLILPDCLSDLMGERVEKRFNELALLIGRTPEVTIGE